MGIKLPRHVNRFISNNSYLIKEVNYSSVRFSSLHTCERRTKEQNKQLRTNNPQVNHRGLPVTTKTTPKNLAIQTQT